MYILLAQKNIRNMTFNKALLKKTGVYVAIFICGYAIKYSVDFFHAKQKAQSYIFLMTQVKHIQVLRCTSRQNMVLFHGNIF